MATKPTNRNWTNALLIMGSLITFMASCKKDDNPKPPPSPVTQKLAEFKKGDEFIRLDYNADGTVRKAIVKSDLNTGGAIVGYDITYNAEKKVSFMQSTDGEKIVPVYEDGKMTRADVFEGAQRTGYTNYYYKNGNIDFATIYFNNGDDYEPFLEFRFEYDIKGNLIETVAMMASGEPGRMDRAGHIEYSHDQKTNPLYTHRDLLALFWQAVSKNNITTENHFDEDLKPEDRFTYAYDYKSNGLPSHATVKQGLPGKPVTTSDVDFIYK